MECSERNPMEINNNDDIANLMELENQRLL